jgi:hypothetical protein
MTDTDFKVLFYYILIKFILIQHFMKQKKKVVKYQVERYNNDEEYKQKKKEYCRMKMREIYNRRKAQAQVPINQT